MYIATQIEGLSGIIREFLKKKYPSFSAKARKQRENKIFKVFKKGQKKR